MNHRFFSTLALALVFASSLAAASPSGENTKKTSAAKKEIKSCCSAESKNKSEKDCMDIDMKKVQSKDTEAKDAHSSDKDNKTNAEKKQDVNGGEKK